MWKKNVFQDGGLPQNRCRGFQWRYAGTSKINYEFPNNKNIMGVCFLGSTNGRFALKSKKMFQETRNITVRTLETSMTELFAKIVNG